METNLLALLGDEHEIPKARTLTPTWPLARELYLETIKERAK